MGVAWNGKKDAIGMIVVLFLVPIIAMMTGLLMPVIESHPVLFGIGYLTVIAVGFIYIVKKKR